MRRDDIKMLKESLGPRGFIATLAELLMGRDGNGREVPKLHAEDVSIRALWEGLVGPVEDTLPGASGRGHPLHYVDLGEAVDSSMFASATGVLIASKVIEGYDMPGMIGDELVTSMPSKLKQERMVGFTSLEGPEEVGEGMPYGESTFAEKFVTGEAFKKGRILEVSEEIVIFDQTGQILLRASRLGELARQEREETILAGVVDVGPDTAVTRYKSVYFPGGTAEDLYTAGNNALLTTTPLVDWTDLDEVLRYHAENVKDDRAVASEQRPIMWMPNTLLVARKLAGTAARILSATEVRSNVASADVTISGNPLRNIVGNLRMLSSPLLDHLATITGSNYSDSDDWFLGDFKRQFIWQEIYPLQTLRAQANDEAQFRRDVVARFKVRYFGGIWAADERHVIKVDAV